MPEIKSFRGYVYNQSKMNLQDVVAPPYDVITPEQRARLYERSPYNIVRLILGREEDRYTSAAKHLEEWQRKAILVRDQKPTVYTLHQIFEGPEGRQMNRKGFIAVCRLEEFEKKIILPHEKTLAQPLEDRFKLIKATNANFSQVFTLYSDPEKRIDRILNGISKSELAADVLFEDVQNKMWRLQDMTLIQEVQKCMSDKQVLIADGHHRYETALAYRDYMRSRNPRHTGKELYNYVMMFFTNIDDEGLVIYPTHRVIHLLKDFDPQDFLKRLDEYFIVHEFRDNQSLMVGLNSSSVSSFGLVMQNDSRHFLLTLKPTISPTEIIDNKIPHEVKELDVTILHVLILKNLLKISTEAEDLKLNIDYVKDAELATEAVRNGRAQLAFIVNPTKIERVRAVAKAGHRMPQKSTYFYPKLLSGLVINKLSES